MKQRPIMKFLRLTIVLVLVLFSLSPKSTALFLREFSEETSYSFSASGLNGGGGQTIIAFDPHQKDRILAGGDCNGFHISEDGGKNWRPANKGLLDHTKFGVAAISFSPSTPGLVYAGVGRTNGTGGAFLRSVDGGLTWELMSDKIQFSGARNRSNQDSESLRLPSIGKLISLDEYCQILYAGTYKQGVFLSMDDGKTWEYMGLQDKWIRCLTLLPDRTTLYVGTFGHGLYKLDMRSNHAKDSFIRIVSSPDTVEDIVYVPESKELWIAAGADGIMVLDEQGKWIHRFKGSGDLIKGPLWNTLAISESTILAGCHLPPFDPQRNNYAAVIQSTDHGRHWSNAIHQVDHKLYGNPGESWWKQDSRAMIQGNQFQGGTVLGGSHGRVPNIAIDPFDAEKVMMASSGGVYVSENGGTHWQFASKGMQLVVPISIGIAPWGEVFLGMKDWGYVIAHQGAEEIRVWNRHDNAMMMASDFAFNKEKDSFYVLLSPNTTGGGILLEGKKNTHELRIFADLEALTRNREGRAFRMLYDTSGEESVFIVAIIPFHPYNKNGICTIYRSVDGINWTELQKIECGEGEFNLSMHWAGDQEALYVYHSTKGLYRGENGGKGRWIHTDKIPPVSTPYSGYMTASPSDTNQLYISTDTGLYQIHHAHTSNPYFAKIDLGQDEMTGPIAIDSSGTLYVTVPAQDNKPAKLLRVDSAMNVVDIADDFYRSSSLFPKAICVQEDGRIIVANQVNGFTVSNYRD
ncbi:MAG: hypothetical protein PHI40_03730 [Caldisericia bacterium]|nr:hypothetical protein [Caldisericia bacterium]